MRTGNSSGTMTLPTCRLTCGKYGQLWPLPTKTTLGDKLLFFQLNDVQKIFFAGDEDATTLNFAFTTFLLCLKEKYSSQEDSTNSATGGQGFSSNKVLINILIITDNRTHLSLNVENEEYKLIVDSTNHTILCKNYSICVLWS